MPAEPLNEQQVTFLERKLNWYRLLGMRVPYILSCLSNID